jgi:drug/metabolite transporter (DMT)-like permease
MSFQGFPSQGVPNHMHQSIVCAVAAMLCYGVSDFVYKQGAVAGIRADHFLMGQAWFFVPLVWLYALATHTLVVNAAAMWGLLAGALVFIGFYFFIRSLATGAVSTNASIFRMNFIVTVVLVVVLLGEPLTPGKIAGLSLALLATWLLLAPASEQANSAHEKSADATRRRSLVQVVIATLAFGTSHFFHTVGLRHGALPETMAAAQGALFMPLATVVVFATDRNLRPPRITFRYSAATAVMLFGATILLLRGVAEGQASVVVPIAQMGFVIAALLGIFVLHERVTVRKVIGLVSALGALAVLASS